MYGADTDALRDVADTHGAIAEEITEVASELSNRVDSIEWHGLDADGFRAKFQQLVIARSLILAAQLSALERELEEQAAEQDATSAARSSVTLLATRGASTRTAAVPKLNDPRNDTNASPTGPPQDPGIKPGIPGTSAPIPAPQPWPRAPDSASEGSGPHGVEEPTDEDRLKHAQWSAAAEEVEIIMPNASAHMDHYLDGTGETYPVNVDGMLNAMPELRDRVIGDVSYAAREAMLTAKSENITEPTTYPFVTPWDGAYAQKEDSLDWFYAVGGYQYATTGTVTVYPPETPGGEWRYEYSYQVHVGDRYNWDPGKSTDVGGKSVTDEEMGRLHQVGLAQEYDLEGHSSVYKGP